MVYHLDAAQLQHHRPCTPMAQFSPEILNIHTVKSREESVCLQLRSPDAGFCLTFSDYFTIYVVTLTSLSEILLQQYYRSGESG